ncbi:uncharacterized protein LOC129581258 [Paramacrobiotus metropolitanus]|uniref:uncharacterized protein LOC129581258 n=1 Tax=Paramacrobiotus metropolitanus TaxID=2943436 RepID=UPI00244598E0|nr:uncharacterized protein LOC129581258 [Paramacrobiotus metropolitanus]
MLRYYLLTCVLVAAYAQLTPDNEGAQDEEDFLGARHGLLTSPKPDVAVKQAVVQGNDADFIPQNEPNWGHFPNGSGIVAFNARVYHDPGKQNPILTTTTPAPVIYTPPSALPGQADFTDWLPYNANLNLTRETFSGITHYQLNYFMKYYNMLLQNIVNTAGVALEDAPTIYMKQSFYTLFTWYPETMALFGLTNEEQIWSDADTDFNMQQLGNNFHWGVLALVAGDNGTATEQCDELAYMWHGMNLANQHAKFVQITAQSLGDAEQEAARFILGTTVYDDELDSAWESVTRFYNAFSWHYLDMYDRDCIRRYSPNLLIAPDGAIPPNENGATFPPNQQKDL